jgi:predicted O-methyltransferase YrrM
MIFILKNILTKNNFFIIFKKILKRFEKNDSLVALNWAKSHAILSTDDFLKSIDMNLYEESIAVIKNVEKDSNKKLNKIDISLGGGGNYLLLYFLVRHLKPNIVFETGVAAGWSTLAILRAIYKNKRGKLYSSDFPYFRIKNANKYIGYLAKNEKNISDWFLDISGDEIALPNFLKKIGKNKIDLFHYDSDKSYTGRKNSINLIKRNLTKNSVIIFDDIQNNLHFRDYVKNNNFDFRVFEFNNKFVGLIGF